MEYEDRVRISTPEGVDIDLTLAGIGSRFVAALFDFLIQGTLLVAAGFITGVFGGQESLLGTGLFAISFFVIWFGYNVLFEVRSHGQTLGKGWTGLRVVRTGGLPVTFLPSCVRNVMRLIDILPLFYGIGMTSIFFTTRNQRLGDLAGGTLVVRDRPGGKDEEPTAAPAHRGDGWDVSAVSAQDIGTVRQFLARRSGLETAARAELAAELERRLRPRVAGAPERIAAEEFLERLAAAKADRA